MIEAASNIADAFAVNVVAASAIVLAGSVIFWDGIVQRITPSALASMLSLSAGVTLFISLSVLFGRSFFLLSAAIQTDTMDVETAQGHGWLAATCCFGVGVVLIYLLDALMRCVLRGGQYRNEARSTIAGRPPLNSDQYPEEGRGTDNLMDGVEFAIGLQGFSAGYAHKEFGSIARWTLVHFVAVVGTNAPKGIATYVATMQSLAVGIAISIGIGLFNISQGFAMVSAVYFSTNSRMRAILCAFMAAIAECIGGLAAWIILGQADKLSEGILYGVVSGMMVCICVKKTIPAAGMFATKTRLHVVGSGALAGMVVMAASLIFFKYIGV